MDGLDEDADLIFVLTTNRAEIARAGARLAARADRPRGRAAAAGRGGAAAAVRALRRRAWRSTSPTGTRSWPRPTGRALRSSASCSGMPRSAAAEDGARRRSTRRGPARRRERAQGPERPPDRFAARRSGRRVRDNEPPRAAPTRPRLVAALADALLSAGTRQRRQRALAVPGLDRECTKLTPSSSRTSRSEAVGLVPRSSS